MEVYHKIMGYVTTDMICGCEYAELVTNKYRYFDGDNDDSPSNLGIYVYLYVCICAHMECNREIV